MRSKLKHNALSTHHKGITITEVIIAAALLIAAIVPILKAMTGSHSITAKIEQKTLSLTLAQQRMELIRASSINNYNSSFAASDVLLASNYYCDVTDSAVTSDLRQITVSVGYDDDRQNDLDASEIDVSLVTLIARRQ